MSNEVLSALRVQLDEVNKGIEAINSASDGNSANKKLLTKQFESKSKLFKEKYGIEVTTDNIEQVLQTLIESKKKEYASVQQIVLAIQEGDIDRANKLAGVEVKEEKVAEKVDEAIQPSNIVTEPIVTPTATVTQETVATPQSTPTVANDYSDIKPIKVDKSVINPISVPSANEDEDIPIPVPVVKAGVTAPTTHKIVVPVEAEVEDDAPVKAPITMGELRENKVNDFMNNLTGNKQDETVKSGSALAGTGFASILNNPL